MPRPGHFIALCVVALLCIGAVMVQSASMTTGEKPPAPLPAPTMEAGSPSEFASSPVSEAPLGSEGVVTFKSIVLSRQVAYMTLAIIAMIAASRLPVLSLLNPRRLGPPPERTRLSVPTPLIAATLALLFGLALVYVPGVGREVNGSARWVQIPVAGSLQPSEIAKWALPILLGLYAAWQTSARMRSFRALIPALAITGILTAFIIKEDLGTGVLMLGVAAVVLVAAGARIWHFALFVPPAMAALAFAALSSDYRRQRLEAFLDPWADPEGAGYHMIQSMLAVANGQGFGRGLGFGLQKFGYLPEDHSDFLFAVICEELGIAGAATVIALYLAILAAGTTIVRNAPTMATRLIALGVLATLGGQAVINLGVVTGLGPTKGIALPLLSSGGTGWILTAFSLGLLIALDRESHAGTYASSEAPMLRLTTDSSSMAA
ncbi:MAG: FtsW/RodA/SpoVE family cell cycle protein [Phycisphaerales bacterium]